MVGIGRALVRGLGAALEGAGTGMLQQEQVKQRDREAAALEARERAMMVLREESANRLADRAQTRSVELHRDQTAIDLGALPRKLEITDRFQQGQEARAEKREETAAERTQRHRREAIQLQHDLGLSADQARAAAEERREVEKTRGTVASERITADGRLVMYNARGEVIHTTDPGMFNPTNAPRADAAGASLSSFSRGGAAPPRAAPAAPAPVGVEWVWDEKSGKLVAKR